MVTYDPLSFACFGAAFMSMVGGGGCHSFQDRQCANWVQCEMNRESGDSEPSESNCAISRSRLKIDRLRIGLAILNQIFAILLRFHSFLCVFAAEILANPGPRFWESCSSQFAILCRRILEFLDHNSGLSLAFCNAQ